MFLDLINERKKARTANSRLPQWGLTWLNQVQCFYQHLCLIDREVLSPIRERQVRALPCLQAGPPLHQEPKPLSPAKNKE